MPTYSVFAEDNFHRYEMDKDARHKIGDYQTCADAIRACKSLIDRFLADCDPGLDAKKLFERYRTFGEDPYIRTDDPNCKFLAWDYAWEQCQKLRS